MPAPDSLVTNDGVVYVTDARAGLMATMEGQLESLTFVVRGAQASDDSPYEQVFAIQIDDALLLSASLSGSAAALIHNMCAHDHDHDGAQE